MYEFHNILELSLPLCTVLSLTFRISRTAGFTETCYMEVQAQRRVGFQATGWMVRVSNLGKENRFSSSPKQSTLSLEFTQAPIQRHRSSFSTGV